jgi:hypothetical protein
MASLKMKLETSWLWAYVSLTLSQSQSQSYFTTDGQSVSSSWCRAQFGTFDQRIFFFESYSLVLIRAPSLTRGRVCQLSVYSQSTVVSQYLHKIFTYCVIHI